MSSDMARVTWPRIVLFGDSITQYSFSTEGGWGSLLADRLQRKCDVVNRGFSGYNTRWCRTILPRLLGPEDVSNTVAITIFLGANDSCMPDLNPAQHVPLQEYHDNLVAMVNDLQTLGVSKDKVILIGPPACDVEKWGAVCKEREMPLSKDEEVTSSYAESCRQAAQDTGVEFVDLHKAMTDSKPYGKFLNDGLHLSQQGALLLDTLLWPLIEKRTAQLPLVMLDWKNVDFNNPKQSLL